MKQFIKFGAGRYQTCIIHRTRQIHHSTRINRTREPQFVKRLSKIKDLKVLYLDVNFLLLENSHLKITSTQVREELGKEGLLIRERSICIGIDNSYFRLTRPFRRRQSSARICTQRKKSSCKIKEQMVKKSA